MELPKFLIADNSSFKDDLFIVHTEYPRFILNVSNDEVHWLEGFFSKLKFMPQERVRNQMNLVGVDIFVKTRLVKREI